MRLKKIMNKALVASHTKELNDSGMALQEKKTLKELLHVIEKHGKILEEIFSDGFNGAERKKDLNNLSVKVLSDIPEFVGMDEKEYGPFSKGDVVSLPLKIAKLLSSKKLVEVES